MCSFTRPIRVIPRVEDGSKSSSPHAVNFEVYVFPPLIFSHPLTLSIPDPTAKNPARASLVKKP
jgi:hypothetical protein